MNQIKYAFEDIMNNKTRNIILLVQVVASMLLLCYIFKFSFDLINLKNKIAKTSGHEKTYMMFDISDEKRLFSKTFMQKDILSKLNSFYTYLADNKRFDSYTYNSFYLGISDTIPDDTIASLVDNNNKKRYNALEVNGNFVNYFSLKCAEGRIFNKYEYIETAQYTPAILGNMYHKFFKLGDIIDNKYKVIGFLESKSFYFNIQRTGNLIALDKFIILPIQTNKFSDFSFSDYDILINNTYILAESKDILADIQEKSSKLGLYTYKFVSLDEQLEKIGDSTNEWVQSLSCFCLVVLFFSIIGVTSTLLQYLNSHSRELVIHLLCGGRLGLIIQRMFLQVFFIMLLADIIMFLVFGVSKITIISLFTSILISIIIVIIPSIKLGATDINVLLRRNE